MTLELYHSTSSHIVIDPDDPNPQLLHICVNIRDRLTAVQRSIRHRELRIHAPPCEMSWPPWKKSLSTEERADMTSDIGYWLDRKSRMKEALSRRLGAMTFVWRARVELEDQRVIMLKALQAARQAAPSLNFVYGDLNGHEEGCVCGTWNIKSTGSVSQTGCESYTPEECRLRSRIESLYTGDYLVSVCTGGLLEGPGSGLHAVGATDILNWENSSQLSTNL
ncbi:uncharacterized protein H6S33_002842 [Morchella sextelata]|jgi:hypothetical protein|uniref:uncharacterized protein n=1 Tax=Morchella sextelata TaxID=1174677 RepID=UPI001D054819|nr:uncharacterized protein H6S33_002842 [Morchella sextelata]KAH0607808.1 hypothetical protein H6S33_002842 [Morchella sextelata]